MGKKPGVGEWVWRARNVSARAAGHFCATCSPKFLGAATGLAILAPLTARGLRGPCVAAWAPRPRLISPADLSPTCDLPKQRQQQYPPCTTFQKSRLFSEREAADSVGLLTSSPDRLTPRKQPCPNATRHPQARYGCSSPSTPLPPLPPRSPTTLAPLSQSGESRRSELTVDRSL